MAGIHQHENMKALQNFHVFATAEQLAIAAADFIQDSINRCIQHQSYCRIALPGGNTPALCLQQLSRRDLPWSRLIWYMGDERCLPVGDPQRNDTMIRQQLFSTQQVGAGKFYPIEAQFGAQQAAADYAMRLAAFDHFDLVLLGMGEDGHTASLFPGNPALQDKRKVVPVFNAPKPPAERVSLGLSTLASARLRVVLATGKNKTAALNKIRSGDLLPINLVGEKHWFVDKKAAG